MSEQEEQQNVLKRVKEDEQGEDDSKKRKTENITTTVNNTVTPTNEKSTEKYQKKRTALFVGYLGTAYNGSQTTNFTNPNVVTVEETLFKAICKAGGVAECNSSNMNKVHFHRSSRTDKGVHAAVNVMEMKLILVPDIEQKIRENLPEDIKFFGYKRVSNAFNAKEHCNSRTYEYILPAFTFVKDPRHGEWFRQINVDKITEEDVKNNDLVEIDDSSVGEEEVKRANEILKKFIGTHSFHNYTLISKAKKNSYSRHITKFECSQPFYVGGVKVVKLTVCGASFVYNQIRKMVGFLIGCMRGIFSEDEFETTVNKSLTISVPLAPANGLLLAGQDYKRYNQKAGSLMHGAVTFTDYSKDIDSFKEVIYEHMMKIEKETIVMKKFLLYIRGWILDKSVLKQQDKEVIAKENVQEEIKEEVYADDE
ncbi:hypothetical protein ABK040_015685 [Willaertia magna]